MAAGIALRGDFDAAGLRGLAKRSKDAGMARRLLALAAIYDGGARGPDGLVDAKAPGPKSKLDDAQRRALVAKIEAGPIPAVDGVVRWRLIDLAQWVFEEYGVTVTKQILSRELRALGYRKLSARPRHHEKSEAAAAAFKKTSPTSWRTSRRRPAASR